MDKLENLFHAHWLQVVLILASAYLARKFAMIIIERLIRKAVRSDSHQSHSAEKQREDTLITIVDALIRAMVWVVATMLLLSMFGVDIAPLIAGAGIAGVALGFGAQSMVKDFLAGFFIIIENQYRVGDVVQINQGVAGVVEHLTLRQTVLRDLDGMVHNVPNGNIEVATNMTMEFANVNLDVGVDYSSDIDKVEKIINAVGKDIAGDEAWKSKIVEPPEMLRVEDFADSAIIVKIVGKTAPMQQWAVTGELRKRLKREFDKNGISIPFPQRVMHNAKKSSD
ncbi:MAG: mechanosensitive ion channel family protein [Candidatus Saccharibacteria bacterium]|nr:mechanosensitive ion channel family protein [Candidatus Saccharibacteria bacterium]